MKRLGPLALAASLALGAQAGAPRADFDARLAVVANVQRHRLSPCGHMLHHDQPLALAAELAAFVARAPAAAP